MAILLLLNQVYGYRRMQQVDAEVASLKTSGKIFRVGIAQGALAAGLETREESFQKTHLEIQNRLTGRALKQGALDLMIWPESAYARFLKYEKFQGMALNPKINGKDLSQVIRSDIPYRVPLLLNARGSAQNRSYNLSFLIGRSGDFLGLVEKRQLFPFGEYMPYGHRFPFLYHFSPKTADLSPGDKPQVLITPQGAKLGVLICYEDLYPHLARDQAGLGANLLVNMTNDIWFGTGWVLEQHLHFSALRAIENRRFLLRAVNTGVSAIIDPVGRVIRRLEPEARSYLVDTVALMNFKTYHCATGDLFYYLGACILLFELLICLSLKYKPF
jgi:apolipoprotein N-acyltransferase